MVDCKIRTNLEPIIFEIFLSAVGKGALIRDFLGGQVESLRMGLEGSWISPYKKFPNLVSHS